MKVKQEDGTEIEVLTQAEVDTKLAAEKTAWEQGQQGVVTEKDTQITKLSTEKADLEKKLEEAKLGGIKEDHPNFKILKDALAAKDTDITKLRGEIETDKKTRKQEAFDTAIKTATKGNEELEKKVRHHLEKTLTSMADNTAEERQSKLEAAIKLSVDQNTPGMFDGGIGAGGFNGKSHGSGDGAPEFTAREKSLGSKMGITDKDYQTYGPRLNKKNK